MLVTIFHNSPTLQFVFKKKDEYNNWYKGAWLANKRIQVIGGNDWETVTEDFYLSSSEECRFRIDADYVSQAPSSLQIRNIRLVEYFE